MMCHLTDARVIEYVFYPKHKGGDTKAIKEYNRRAKNKRGEPFGAMRSAMAEFSRTRSYPTPRRVSEEKALSLSFCEDMFNEEVPGFLERRGKGHGPYVVDMDTWLIGCCKSRMLGADLGGPWIENRGITTQSISKQSLAQAILTTNKHIL